MRNQVFFDRCPNDATSVETRSRLQPATYVKPILPNSGIKHRLSCESSCKMLLRSANLLDWGVAPLYCGCPILSPAVGERVGSNPALHLLLSPSDSLYELTVS